MSLSELSEDRPSETDAQLWDSRQQTRQVRTKWAFFFKGHLEDDFSSGVKITADGDCNHEIKKHLLLGRKAMTNLDSILKSRDITLSTKVRLVKAMVVALVVYRCESWTIKKVEHQRLMLLNYGVGEDS